METEHEATSAEARLAAAEQALEETLAERNRLWAQFNEQRADQRELEQLRADMRAIKSSALWKVVGRYQRFKRVLRIGLERLRQL